jgi:hypothetical protein
MKAGWAHMFLWVAALAGCYRDFTIAPQGGIDAGRRRVDAGFAEPLGTCAASSGVDLLFVIDNSRSMLETQARLSIVIPDFVRMLIEPPDLDGDAEPDWEPVVDLRVGVITPDLGAGPRMPPSCSEYGDDGRLRTSSANEDCAEAYPPVLRFASDTPSSRLSDLSCVLQTGGDGCGFEQPLEAWLKALSPRAPASYTLSSYVPPRFLSGEGHGDGAHAGFVRNDTLLAVVVVTDEDDCSALDLELFDLDSIRYGGDLNLRCSSFPEALFPVERYVEGLLALRARRPDLVAFSVIAGIPVETATELPDTSDFQAMLEDPRMQQRPDPMTPGRLLASCSTLEGSLALPPRRLVRVAAGLGAGRATVQSICEPDFRAVMSPIAQLIVRRACAERTPL